MITCPKDGQDAEYKRCKRCAYVHEIVSDLSGNLKTVICQPPGMAGTVAKGKQTLYHNGVVKLGDES